MREHNTYCKSVADAESHRLVFDFNNIACHYIPPTFLNELYSYCHIVISVIDGVCMLPL